MVIVCAHSVLVKLLVSYSQHVVEISAFSRNEEDPHSTPSPLSDPRNPTPLTHQIIR